MQVFAPGSVLDLRFWVAVVFHVTDEYEEVIVDFIIINIVEIHVVNYKKTVVSTGRQLYVHDQTLTISIVLY